ncbi:VanZ family protein [Rathayibacter sp. AY1C9]|nr:VanZ family protein [Rathayibacter sp. AY1C9]
MTSFVEGSGVHAFLGRDPGNASRAWRRRTGIARIRGGAPGSRAGEGRTALSEAPDAPGGREGPPLSYCRRMTSAVLALLFGSAVALVGLVPWAALQYRRRGVLGIGNAVLAFAAVVYALALVTYTLLPLPDEATVAAACRTGSGPQLRLFAFVGDIAKEGGIDGPRALLTNPASAQVLLNVVFFVPLGMLVRHLALRGRLVAGLIGGTVVGFAVSLLIEVTQLTGDWFLYPCAYRLFDVDDLLANTAGALLGTLLSPVLLLFTRRTEGAVPELARPVTIRRRAFGMFCDVLALSLITGALVSITGVGLVLAGVDTRSSPGDVVLGALPFVAPLLQLVIVLRSGRTLGETVVRLRPEPRPLLWQRLVRWAAGSGGWSTLLAVEGGFWSLLAFVLAAAAMIGLVATRGRRGTANALARLDVVDERAEAPSAIRKTD